MFEVSFLFQNNVLNLTVAKFASNGQFLGLAPAALDLLSLCPGLWGTVRFGAHFKQDCVIPASFLLSVGQQATFFELYLQYWDKSDSMLYALPVLTLNLKDGARFPNKVCTLLCLEMYFTLCDYLLNFNYIFSLGTR